ncbi:MAG: ATP-binding protein [Candidatus Polarisedimenticolia bacterium]
MTARSSRKIVLRRVAIASAAFVAFQVAFAALTAHVAPEGLRWCPVAGVAFFFALLLGTTAIPAFAAATAIVFATGAAALQGGGAALEFAFFVAGACVVRAAIGRPPRIDVPRDALVLAGATLGVAAFDALTAHALLVPEGGWSAAAGAALAQATSTLALGAPLLILAGPTVGAWLHGALPQQRTRAERRGAPRDPRAFGAAAALALTTVAAGASVLCLSERTAGYGAYLLLVPLVWGSVRFGLRGFAWVALAADAVSLAHVAGAPVQFHLFVMVLCGLLVAAAAEGHRRLLRSLRHAAEGRQALLDALPDMMFRESAGGVFLEFHGASDSPLIAKPASFVGRRAAEILPPPLAALDERMRRRALETRALQQYEYSLPLGGEELWFEARIVPCGDEETLAVVRDVTERRRAEEDRRQFEAQIRHAQKLESLGVLAGGIAHDFNNLLAAVLGNIELAALDIPAGCPAAARAADAGQAARRAADLTRQLLAYSGKGKMEVVPVDLSAVAREMGRLLAVSISKTARVEYLLADDLPPVTADPSQIRQVFMNLLTNASEALGGRDGLITVRTGEAECEPETLRAAYRADDMPRGRAAFIEVGDNGCGMDEETKSRLFDPFFSTKFTGRGLGMAAVLGIVRGHRGAIDVVADPGRGSIVRVYFPAAATAGGGAADEAREPAGVTAD